MKKYIIVFDKFDLVSKVRFTLCTVACIISAFVMLSTRNPYLYMLVMLPGMVLSYVGARIAFARGCSTLRTRDARAALLVDGLIADRF